MGKPEHLLVIRFSAMGDVAMTLPVIKALSEQYPKVTVTLLTRNFFRPLFQDLENVKVFSADLKGKHKGVFGLKKLSSELLQLNVGAVADLHNVLRSKILKFFFSLAGLPVKQLNKGRREKKALTRRNNKHFTQLKRTHQRYADVFSQLGYPVDLGKVEPLKSRQLSAELRSITGEKTKKWIGIAPFAQHMAKIYPEDLMRQVLQKLAGDTSVTLLLFGGGELETERLSIWEKDFPNIISLAGKCSFEEELSIISNLDVMLSMDSGNGHLAANYGVPVVTIWGLTHPFTGFAPFGQPSSNSLIPDLEKFPAIPTSVYGKTVPEGYEDAIRTIDPEIVINKIKQVISAGAD